MAVWPTIDPMKVVEMPAWNAVDPLRGELVPESVSRAMSRSDIGQLLLLPSSQGAVNSRPGYSA
jgi:hypothetical protein